MKLPYELCIGPLDFNPQKFATKEEAMAAFNKTKGKATVYKRRTEFDTVITRIG